MAKILCLSDIHFMESEKSYVYGEKFSEKLIRSVGIDKLDVLFAAIEEMGPIDLLVFCGDYIVGKNDKEEKRKSINKFIDFLERVENSTNIFRREIRHTCDRILIVPGNHDINRDESDILDDFNRKLNKYLTPFESKGRRQKYAPVFIFNKLKLIVACESTVNNSATINEEVNDVLMKIDKLGGDNDLKEYVKSILDKYMLFDIPSITESIRRDFIEANIMIEKEKKYEDYIKIMVCHHPLLDGIETANTIKQYKGTVGGYSFMKSAVNFGYRLFIHGHIHESSCIEVIDHNMENSIPIIQMGVPMMEIESDKCGAVLIDTDVVDDNIFPFTSALLKLDTISRKFKQVRMLNNEDHKKINNYGDKILIDKEISQLIKDNIIIKNGDLRNVEAASYDCALGYEFKRGKTKYCNWDDVNVEYLKACPDKPGFIEIEPNETILIFTYEEFNIPNDMVLHASPISSWLRKGIRVDLSFLVDPGFKGKFSFPVTNESSESIYINSRDPIVSVEFIKLSGACDKNWRDRHKDRVKARLELKQ